MPHNKGILRIGTSNLVVPGTKKDYPLAFQTGTKLSYYGSLFNTVELNATFYKLPLAKTFEKWATEVPDDFRFTLKLIKQITHAKKLAFAEQDLDRFMEAADRLGTKKGCLLLQFPASITSDYNDHLEQLLGWIEERNEDNGWRIVVEVRHASWYHDITYNLLNRNNASLVFHDKPNSRTPSSNQATSVIYLRYHGPKGDYKESYPDAFLYEEASAIKEWLQEGKEVYVYFNNTMGSALQNVQTLQKLTEFKSP